MDAINLLISDHRKVDNIFHEFEQGGDAQQFTRLFQQLNQELTVHTKIEETVFYPAVEQFPALKAMIGEAYQEHAQVKQALQRLTPMDNTTSAWSNEMTKLMQDVKHHVQEEENDLFPRVREMMTASQLDDLGMQLEAAKSDAMMNQAVANRI